MGEGFKVGENLQWLSAGPRLAGKSLFAASLGGVMKRLSILVLSLSVLFVACGKNGASGTSKIEREKAGATSGGDAASTSGSRTSGIIKQAVLAKHITPLTSSPFDVTDKFPTDQGSIWTVVTVSNAPSGTKLKAVLTDINASDASNPIPPNTKLGENESTANEHSQNIGFNWTYSKTPVGSYKVDIYLNGNLDRTLNFSVTKDAAGSGDASPKTSAIGTCPKLAPANEKPPGFPMGVAVARGVDGNGKPVNPARMFRPDSGPIYAALVGEKIPANTKVAIRWFATDTGGLAQFSSNQVVATGSGNPWFSTAPPVAGTKWPEGLYRVEMDVNGNLAMVVDFGVCDGPCKFQVPIAWTLG